MILKKYNEYSINENSENKSRIIYVSGGDYASLQFKDTFEVTKVIDIINNPDNYKSEGQESIMHDDPYWELRILDFNGDINEEFVSFIKSTIQTYDDSKHENFWLENETI